MFRAVARKKLQPRRTHGPLYEISRMKSSNIISLIKKIKNPQYLVKFYRGECLGSPHTGYGGDVWMSTRRRAKISATFSHHKGIAS